MPGLAINTIAGRARWRGHGGNPPPPPISAVDATGWKSTMVTPAELSLSPITVSRQGFDATGTATSYSETLFTTKRVRQPYPNQATLTSSTVALSDYVYSTDTIASCTNNSTEVSPKPVANWSLPDRQIVGNSIDLRLVAFHRNGRGGKPVACVIFRATDGTTTVTSTVSSLTATTDSLTGLKILEFVTTLDITSLSGGPITVNARVYPWIGTADSVLDSADQSEAREFSPRTYRKDTSLAAAPYLVYVKATGSDSTGAVSTNAAIAAASPCLTLTGAINRARTVLGTGSGALNGLRVRLDAGTWSRASSPTANTVDSEVVIEPIPGVSKASCIFEFGAVNNSFNLAYVRHKGLTVRRQGVYYPFNTAAGKCVFDDCSIDFNGQTGALASNAAYFHWLNCAMTGQGGSTLNAGAAAQAMIRGCTFGSANSNTQNEAWLMLGNSTLGGRNASGTRTQSGAIIAFNKFMALGYVSGPVFGLEQGTAGTIDGFAVVQNIFEFTSATSNPTMKYSADSGPENTRHAIYWHNTMAGFNDHGRSNLLYNETSGDPRTHTLPSFVGNIHVQINTKHDIFCGVGGYPDASTRTGGWAYLHGVGCRGEFSRYRDAGSGSFTQDYGGLSSSIGTVNTGAGNDPLFTTPAHTTSGPAVGAGNGTYTLQGGSPAQARVTESPLGYDLAGTARSGTVASGAYA